MTTLTATNINLAASLTLSNNKLVTAFQDVACLTCTIVERCRKTGYKITETASEVGWAKGHFCWTCGYTYEQSSHDCPRPATRHQKGATKAKRVGVSTNNQPSWRTQVTNSYKNIVMINLIFNSLITASQTRAITDSGLTSHFVGANTPCNDKLATTNEILVGLPYSANMQATHTALLLFPKLSLAARRANTFPALQSRALTTVSLLPSARTISHWSSKTSPSSERATPEMVFITSTSLLACNPPFKTLYLYKLLTHTVGSSPLPTSRRFQPSYTNVDQGH